MSLAFYPCSILVPLLCSVTKVWACWKLTTRNLATSNCLWERLTFRFTSTRRPTPRRIVFHLLKARKGRKIENIFEYTWDTRMFVHMVRFDDSVDESHSSVTMKPN